MDAVTALRGKRDTRAYTTELVPDDLLERALDAGRMAGWAKNNQPVRVVVVHDPQTKVGLKAAGDFAAWIDEATNLIVATVKADAGPRKLFDVGRHSQNLMVAAHAEGLASCPVTLHHPEVASELLGIPDDIDPSMILTLGWPAPGGEAPAQIAGPRLPLDDYVCVGFWS